MQDCSISIANALEILQSCTEPSKYHFSSASIYIWYIEVVRHIEESVSWNWFRKSLVHCSSPSSPLNTLRPRQNEQHFADDIFKRIFFNENFWILIKISLKFVPKGPINNIPAFVQIMAWRRSGDKPLSERMMANLPTHICVTRPQWVKPMLTYCQLDNWEQTWNFCSLWPCDAIWHLEILVTNGSGNGLLPDDTKPLNDPMLTYCQFDFQIFWHIRHKRAKHWRLCWLLMGNDSWMLFETGHVTLVVVT